MLLLVPESGRQGPGGLHTGPFVGWMAFVLAIAGIFAQISKGSIALTLIVLATILGAGMLFYFAYVKLAGKRRFAAIAVSVLLAVSAVVLTVRSDSPKSPLTAAQPSTTSPGQATTTAETTTTATPTTSTAAPPPPAPPPPALPPRPAQEKDIRQATTAEFFDGAVLIGAGIPGITGIFLNLTTDSLDCPDSHFSVGERKYLEGIREGARNTFTVTLMKVEDSTVTVRVQELPMRGLSGSPYCPSQG